MRPPATENTCYHRKDVDSFHGGPNAWDSQGRHFVLTWDSPRKLYWSTDGGRTYQLRHTFSGADTNIATLFIDSNDVIFAHVDDGDGEGLYRSTDAGQNWTKVLPFRVLGMDEDANGNLYAGRKGSQENGCQVWKSNDGGINWVDISDPSWDDNYVSGNRHVHDCKIDPDTNWIYVAVGDQSPCKNCWRSKNVYSDLAQEASQGQKDVVVEDGSIFSVGDSVKIFENDNSEDNTINSISGNTLTMSNNLQNTHYVSKKAQVFKLDWVEKCWSGSDYQYLTITFKGDYIYLSNDEFDGQVNRFDDDGTSTKQTHSVVLEDDQNGSAWVLVTDEVGRLWVAFVPFPRRGRIYTSTNGISWTPREEVPAQTIETWGSSKCFSRATHMKCFKGDDWGFMITHGIDGTRNCWHCYFTFSATTSTSTTTSTTSTMPASTTCLLIYDNNTTSSQVSRRKHSM